MKPATRRTSNLRQFQMAHREVSDDFFRVRYIFYTIDTKFYTIENGVLFEPEYGLAFTPTPLTIPDGMTSHREAKFKLI